MRRLLRRQEFWLALLTLLLGVGIGLASPAFWSLANLFDVCQSSTVMGLFALGVLIVLVSGGIDVSFAAIGAFSMYVTSKVLLAWGFQGSAAIAFCWPPPSAPRWACSTASSSPCSNCPR